MIKMELCKALAQTGLKADEGLFTIGAVALIEEMGPCMLSSALGAILDRSNESFEGENIDQDINVINVLLDYFNDLGRDEVVQVLLDLRDRAEQARVA